MRKGMSVVVWERERGVDLALEAERLWCVAREFGREEREREGCVWERGLRYERVCG